MREHHRGARPSERSSISDRIVICLRGATWRLYPCKIWTGWISAQGYPKRPEGRKGPGIMVHVESLEQKLGRPAQTGMHTCHHCDVKACYEPEHLYEGMPRDNARDMAERGRQHLQVLTRELCIEIRNRYSAGGISQRELARSLGVSQKTVWRVVNNGGGWYDRPDVMAEDALIIRQEAS